jgi:hypothetical protein
MPYVGDHPIGDTEISVLLAHVHSSPKYGYLYVDTPKAGCSTIKYTLQCAERGQRYTVPANQGSSAFGYSEFLLDVHDRRKYMLVAPSDPGALRVMLSSSRFKFCFVRNPYTRILSAYIDKIERNEERRVLFLTEFQDRLRETASPISFVDFLQLIRAQAPVDTNPHWRPQHLQTMSGLIDYDVIGRFENFRRDFEAVLRVIDDAAIGFFDSVNEHRTQASERLAYYYSDPMAIKLVADIYGRDFAVFGYSERLPTVG